MKERNYLLDLDGTIYRGQVAIPHAKEFVNYLKRNNRRFLLLTNCPGNSPDRLRQKLYGMDIEVGPEHILTSGQATASYIAALNPAAKVYLIGSTALGNELMQRGMRLVEENADYVVVGYDKDFHYEKMKKASQMIFQGAQFICTNSDNAIPEGDMLVPHTGAIALSIQAVTGVEPVYIGKPNEFIIDEALKRLNCTKDDCCIIGDRLDTDILTGVKNEIESYLVLTGVTDRQQLQGSAIKPDKVFDNLKDIMDWELGTARDRNL